MLGRFPHGKRGLKYDFPAFELVLKLSLPPREAWIEIIASMTAAAQKTPSLPPREAWIEMHSATAFSQCPRSLPPREAWIEIQIPA